MTIVNCGSCGVRVKVPESKMGGRDKCPSCAKDLFPESPPLPEDNGQPSLPLAKQIAGEIANSRAQAAADGSLAHLAKIEKLLEKMVDHFERDQRAKVYKVVILDNNFLTAQFNPAKIETLLNEHAQGGWTVKGMAEFNPPSFTGDARAIMVVMERYGHAPLNVPSAQRRPREDEVTEEERVALEAMGLSNEGTKPKGLR